MRWRGDDRILQRLADDVAPMRDMVADTMSLKSDTNIPLGVRSVLRDTFNCQICHSVPVKPPVIMTKCCKNIPGCQECTNTWYSGPEVMTRSCPMCHAEQGCNETMVLCGLTDFLGKSMTTTLKATQLAKHKRNRVNEHAVN